MLPAGHALTAGYSVRVRDLANEPFILTRAGCERMILTVLAARGVTPNVSHEVSEASSILALVGQGLGVSIMPGLAANQPPDDVILRPLRRRAKRRLSLASLARTSTTPTVRAVLNIAAAITNQTQDSG